MLKEHSICQMFSTNETFLKAAINFVKPYLFLNDIYRSIVEQTMEYYEKNKTLKDFQFYYLDSVADESNKEVVKKLFADFNTNAEISDIDKALDETVEWVRHRQTLKVLSSGIEEWESIEKGNQNKNNFNYLKYIEALKKINSAVNKTENSNVFNFKNDSLAIRETLMNDEVRRIPFKSKILNDLTRGGIYRKSLNVVAAPIHHGKSRFLSSIAAEYMEASKENNVLYITLEIPKNEVVENFEIHFLNTDYTSYRSMSNIEYLKLKKEKLENIGNLLIVEYPTGQLTINGLKAIMDDALNNDFNFNVVIIDYLGLMKNNNKMSSYENGEIISQQLRGLAMEYDIVLWTAAQVNRTGAKKHGHSDMTDIADSFAIGQTADFVLFGYKDKKLFKANKMLWFIDKNRPGHIVWTNIIADTTTYMFNFVDFNKVEKPEDDDDESEEVTEEINNNLNKLKSVTSLMNI